MKKRILSSILATCIAFASVVSASSTAFAQSVDESSSVSATATESVGTTDGLADSIQDGQILQCWNWSYNGIKNNMAKIAEQGFTAIQTSPIQTIKESTQSKTMSGSWWVYYQPSNFTIDTSSQNALGTKSEFKAMCETAHQYGVKVIVDAVLNHMANAGDNTLSSTIPSDIRNDSNCWHSIYTNTSNWSSRWDITHNCMGGLPDLNTGNTKIQNYAITFLKECADCGVDGFRFDGAKHIELPSDYENASSNYWSNVLGTVSSYAKSTASKDLYYYGEVLDSTGGGQTITSRYTQYMSLTVNTTANDIRNAVNSGNASGAARSDLTYSDSSNVSASKAVLWNESHDTYADNASRGQSDTTMKKTWALVGSRAEVVGMYLARPSSYSNSIGTASVTAWGDTEVAAVNHFRNAFTGQSEYLASSGSIAYNERGTSGVVLVNLSGNSTSVSVTAHKMASGTYTDQITGNTFTVSGGKISGTIGSTGIAVVYNAKPASPSATITPGTKSYKTDTLSLTVAYNSTATSAQYSIDGGAYTSIANGGTITIGSGLAYGTKTTVSIKASDGSTTSDPVTYTYTKVDPSAVQMVYFDNSSYNWSSVYAYIYYGSSLSNASWPGVKMTYDSTTGYYALEVPEELANGKVIFTESSTASTNRYPADMEPGLDLEGTTKLFTANHKLVDYSAPVTTTAPVATTEPTEATTAQPTTAQPTTTSPSVRVLIGDTDFDGNINIRDAVIIQRYLINATTISDMTKFMLAADVNDDGMISVADASTIQRYVIKLSDYGKCGEYTDTEDPTEATKATEATQATEATKATQATEATQADNYVYVKTSWSSVNAYYWSDSDTKMTTWPGVAMESVGNGVFRLAYPENATYIIFNNGSAQTADLTLQGAGKIYSNGSWSNYSGSSSDSSSDSSSSDTYTITFTNNMYWSNVYCYYWSDTNIVMTTWPGTAMTSTGTNDYGQQMYEIVIPANAGYVIFNDGNGSQTVDIPVSSSSKYYISGGSDTSYTVETW